MPVWGEKRRGRSPTTQYLPTKRAAQPLRVLGGCVASWEPDGTIKGGAECVKQRSPILPLNPGVSSRMMSTKQRLYHECVARLFNWCLYWRGFANCGRVASATVARL